MSAVIGLLPIKSITIFPVRYFFRNGIAVTRPSGEIIEIPLPCMHGKTHYRSHSDRCVVDAQFRYASFRKNPLALFSWMWSPLPLVRFGNRLRHAEENYVLDWLEWSFADAARE